MMVGESSEEAWADAGVRGEEVVVGCFFVLDAVDFPAGFASAFAPALGLAGAGFGLTGADFGLTGMASTRRALAGCECFVPCSLLFGSSNSASGISGPLENEGTPTPSLYMSRSAHRHRC